MEDLTKSEHKNVWSPLEFHSHQLWHKTASASLSHPCPHERPYRRILLTVDQSESHRQLKHAGRASPNFHSQVERHAKIVLRLRATEPLDTRPRDIPLCQCYPNPNEVRWLNLTLRRGRWRHRHGWNIEPCKWRWRAFQFHILQELRDPLVLLRHGNQLIQ